MATGRVPTTANSPLTAKGDLFGYSTTQARVPVGNDGETIVADSSTATGLRYQANFSAGKNFLINGAFNVWQRGTTLTYTNGALNYLPDRFFSWVSGTSNVTVSQQTFTPGTAPVAGYEGQYFMRNAVNSISGQSIQAVGQRIEDVRTLAGQTATFSFWAKADASRTYTTRFIQNFGSGGSSEVSISGGSHSVTTSWQRFSVTVSIASVSGKTIGTSSYLQPLLDGPANTVNTLDTWGWQLEAGSVATAFQTATGTLQGELAACRRYLPAITTATGFGQAFFGYAYATNGGIYSIPFDVQARVAPTGISIPTVSGSTFIVYNKTNNDISASAISFDVAGVNGATVLSTGTLTQGDATRMLVKGSAGYILFTGCEL